jgi:8-oxo-dGTP diphosphatase
MRKPYGLCVKAVLRDGEGRVLLLKRPDGARNYPGVWDLPGGKVDTGETPDQALVREVREETGLEVQVLGLLRALEWEMPENRVICLLMIVDLEGGRLRLSPEHDSHTWAAPEQIRTEDMLGGFPVAFDLDGQEDWPNSE